MCLQSQRKYLGFGEEKEADLSAEHLWGDSNGKAVNNSMINSPPISMLAQSQVFYHKDLPVNRQVQSPRFDSSLDFEQTKTKLSHICVAPSYNILYFWHKIRIKVRWNSKIIKDKYNTIL